MRGIVAYGVYVPSWRLERKALATALGTPSGSGTRSVASYDEDTTSLGVEAARAALRRAPRLAPDVLYFATAQPAYLDKTNATVATAPSRSFAATTPATHPCSPSPSPSGPPRPSSSSAGGCPVSRPHASGRSASASTSTFRSAS